MCTFICIYSYSHNITTRTLYYDICVNNNVFRRLFFGKMYEFSEYVHIKCGFKKLLMPEEEILNVELPKLENIKTNI